MVVTDTASIYLQVCSCDWQPVFNFAGVVQHLLGTESVDSAVDKFLGSFQNRRLNKWETFLGFFVVEKVIVFWEAKLTYIFVHEFITATDFIVI